MGIVGSRLKNCSEILIHRYSHRHVHEHLQIIGIDKSNPEEMNQTFYRTS